MSGRSVLVTGATGYVGGRLVAELLASGHTVRCLARNPEKLAGFPWADQIEVFKGDVTDPSSLLGAFEGIDAAYYLIHSLETGGGFRQRDRQAAEAFRDAAAASPSTRQIVYLGGLGDARDRALSDHLRSRQEVGEVLAAGPVPVTELRAAMIIGSGSASFEMLRHLVDVLPVMVAPRWVHTRCQPVAIRDVLYWLVAAIEHPEAVGKVLEIGGPDVLTYQDMMRVYAEVVGLPKRWVIPVPLLTPRLSSLWVSLVTPLPSAIARPLVAGLMNEVVVKEHPVQAVLPHQPLPLRTAVELALRKVEHLDVVTWWGSAEMPRETTTPADPAPTDADWAGGALLKDERVVESSASPEDLFTALRGVGGARGWYAADWLWEIRGLLDQIFGGVGLRRGRRHPDELRVGDALDFWRVDSYEPPTFLRLRAEMRLPGKAWLEWSLEPDGTGSKLHQRALFHPKGLWGRLYWYVLLPFHGLIFGRMARAIAHQSAKPRTSHA